MKGGRVRIGYLSTLYHTSLLIKGLRWLEKEGVEAQWSLFGTGPAIIDALVRGELDLAYIGLSPVLIGLARDAPIKCIAGGHVEGTVIIGGAGRKTTEELSGDMGKALRQFSGGRLGTLRRGSLHDVFLRHYLSEYGVEGVEVVNYDWSDFIPDAIMKGEVGGAAGTPALAVLSSRLVGARIVVPPNLVWPSNPSYGIVTSDELLRDRQDLLEGYLRLHKRACELLRIDPSGAANAIAETVGLVDRGIVLETLGVSPKYCASLSAEYIESTMRLLPVLRGLGLISADLRQDDIFDEGLIKKVHPEPPHYSSA
jgi:ABC-type nitrate/sulfonate/bicarbonate transport system substrate-binding protein